MVERPGYPSEQVQDDCLEMMRHAESFKTKNGKIIQPTDKFVLSPIQKHLPEWKRFDHKDYLQAYIHICQRANRKRNRLKPSSWFKWGVTEALVRKGAEMGETRKFVVSGMVYETYSIEVEAGTKEHAQRIARELMLQRHPGKKVTASDVKIQVNEVVKRLLE